MSLDLARAHPRIARPSDDRDAATRCNRDVLQNAGWPV
jgi:hypothetical protein